MLDAPYPSVKKISPLIARQITEVLEASKKAIFQPSHVAFWHLLIEKVRSVFLRQKFYYQDEFYYRLANNLRSQAHNRVTQ